MDKRKDNNIKRVKELR